MMGGMEDDKFVSEVELPAREVEVGRSFRMSECAVTRDQWVEVMGCLPSGNEEGLAGDVPVVCVGFADAVAFCRELGAGYRLPSEAEWEYACRAGTTTRFSYGDDPGYTNLTDYAWYEDNSGGRTHPVGQKLPNPWGLYDMHGNVYEWCNEWYSSDIETSVDSAYIDDSRVLRGGSFNYFPLNLRSAYRSSNSPEYRNYLIGFRISRTP